MPYKSEDLERQFKNLGNSRRGRSKYANDANYWTGGRCNWGGNHSLKEDCQTLASGFTKIESLRDIKKELEKCTSKNEYDAKKSNYIRKCDEVLRGLQEKSASSSMFGVCCIWSDEGMDKHVISKLNNFQNEINKLKDDLQREDYKWVQELKQLRLEEKEISKRMEENKRKAMNETDPSKKAILLQLIEDDGEKLKVNLEKQKSLSNKFNLDPNKKVSDMIEAMKRAIEKSRNRSHNPTGNGRGNPNRNPDNDETDSDTEDESNPDDNNRNQDKNETNWFEQNKPMILVGGIILLVIFYFYSSRSQLKEEEYNFYD